jgi:serine/threonine protein kinase
MLIVSHREVQLGQPQYLTLQIMSVSRGAITNIGSLSMALRASRGDLDPMHVNCPRAYALQGPNGIHACLAYQPQYIPFRGSLQPLTSYPPPSGGVPRLPIGIIKSILKQTLLGIESMHRAGWVHGAIGLHSLEIKTRSYPPDLVQGPDDQVFLEKIRHTSDRVHAPLHLTKISPILPTRDDYDENIKIKLGNLGFGKMLDRIAVGDADLALAAFPVGESVNRWHSIAGPYQFRALEMVEPVEEEISRWPSTGGVDIWAFGCLVYRLYTGYHLLPEIMVNKEDPEVPILHYWFGIALIFGRLPDQFLRRWPHMGIWLEPPVTRRFPLIGFEHTFRANAPLDLSEEEVGSITDLIRLAMEIPSRPRPTASELLQHPFFSGLNNGCVIVCV